MRKKTMLTKQEFVNAINAIKSKNDELGECIKDSELRVVFSSYSLQDDMISLLESAMAIPVDPQFGSVISWWIYENDFGKGDLAIILKDTVGNEPDETIYLKTPEDLYEYCKNISAED